MLKDDDHSRMRSCELQFYLAVGLRSGILGHRESDTGAAPPGRSSINGIGRLISLATRAEKSTVSHIAGRFTNRRQSFDALL